MLASRLNYMCFTLGSILFFSLIPFGYVFYNGQILGLEFPLNTYLFRPAERFTDLTWYLSFGDAILDGKSPYFIKNVANGIDLPNIGPIFWSYVLAFFQYFFPTDPVSAFSWIVLGGSFILLIGYLQQSLKQVAELKSLGWLVGLTAFITSYPLLFILDRANLEGVLFLNTAAFWLAYFRKSHKIAIVLLAFATNFKLFPAVFILLYLNKKQWKYFAAFPLICAGLTCLLLAPLDHSIGESLERWRSNTDAYTEWYYAVLPSNWNHSLFNLIKVYWTEYKGLPTNAEYFTLVRGFFPFSVVLAGAVYLWKVRKRSVFQKLLFTTVCMIWLPHISYDYTLVHLYIPFFILITGVASSQIIAGRTVYWTTLLLVISFSTMEIYRPFAESKLTAGFLIHGLSLMALFLISAFTSGHVFQNQKARSTDSN